MRITAGALAAATILLAAGTASAEAEFRAASVREILQENPLEASGKTAAVAGSLAAGDVELQVLPLTQVKMHHHEQEDYIIYIQSGEGVLRTEEGERPISPGDMFVLPKGFKHGLTADEDKTLVLLVTAAKGWQPLEDTVFHE